MRRVAHRAAAQVGGRQDPQARPARTALGRSANAHLRRLAMRSTMMDFPLTVRHIFEHGRNTYADSEVVTNQADGVRRIAFGGGARSGLPGHIDYEELLAAERPGYSWPEIEETAAAAICYTSGTTDLPRSEEHT